MDIVKELSKKRLCFTVTSGRSGTKLLFRLLSEAAGIRAQHEPTPRFNYVLRAALTNPEAARWWLLAEKLPAILRDVGSCSTYAELSHITGKAFIEPMLELGLRPRFLILSRKARDVATSLFKIGAVPERTSAGSLVLIGPSDSNFLPIARWQHLSDYQLCYWYARETECRQSYYRNFFSSSDIKWHDLSFDEIRDWDRFRAVAEFVVGSPTSPDRQRFNTILSENQNSRKSLLNGARERDLLFDLDEQEFRVEQLIAEAASRTARRYRAA